MTGRRLPLVPLLVLGAAVCVCVWAQPPAGNSTYAERAAWYIEQSALRGGRDIWSDLARLRYGAGQVTDAYKDALARLSGRVDGADFYLPALARIVIEYRNSPQLPPGAADEIVAGLLAFQYWLDEGGKHGNLQYWSENHAVLYHASEYVIGSVFPNATFSNSNLTGAEHVAKGRALLTRWLDLRSRIGFSEYASEVYNTFVISALALVADFGPDADVATRAAMQLDLLLLDLSLNEYAGMVTGFRGRSYESNKPDADAQSTSPVQWLLGGVGSTLLSSRGATPIVVARRYAPAAAIIAVAQDRNTTRLATARSGIRTSEAPQYGLGYTDPADGIVWFGLGGYAAPDTIELFFSVPTAYDLWEHEVWEPLAPLRPLAGTGILPQVAALVLPLSEGALLGPVSTAVYRTPYGALGTAVQYQPSFAAYQQHVWQATIGDGAIVYVTHPGPNPSDYALSSWTGGAAVPRASLQRNVLVALYQPPWPTPLSAFYPNRTHAYFPRAAFDEVISRGLWTLARLGDAYVALYSARPTTWTTEGPYADRELVADGGAQNVWICELGSAADDGSFAAFTERVSGGVVEAAWTPPTLEGGGDGLLGCIVRSGCFDPADPVGSLTDCVVRVPIVNPNPPCEDYLDVAGLLACVAACAPGDRLCPVQCARAAVVLDPPVTVPGTMEVKYTDTAGRIVQYGWTSPLTVTRPGQAAEVSQPETLRYRNPYLTAPWGARQFDIQAGGRRLFLDFDGPVRTEA
jgi:hypothetical protein